MSRFRVGLMSILGRLLLPAAILPLAVRGVGATALGSAVLSESGGVWESTATFVSVIGGQAVVGSGQAGRTELGLGAVYSDSAALPVGAALLAPGGECWIPAGPKAILGTAGGEGLSAWSLESAPGRSAVAGFSTLASGTVAVSSSTLGVGDFSGLSGWQTLRLVATGSDGSESASVINVFVGYPKAVFRAAIWPQLIEAAIKPCQ